MASLTTYVAVGNKEDVTGLVTMISPEETPLYSMVGQGKAVATTHSWLNKALRAAKTNTAVEGGELTYEAAKARTRTSNYTQIFQQGYSVTGTQEVVAKWGGIESEIDEAMADALKELALDVEQAWFTSASAEDGDTSTARIAGGLPYFISTNKQSNSTTRAYTETLLKEALQASWEAGGVPKYVFQSGDNQNIANAFITNINVNVDAKSKTAYSAVDVYVSSFGTVNFIPHRQIGNTDVFVLDTQYLSTDFLRPFKDTPLPKATDAEAHNILGELTFVCKAEAAQAWITDLNT
ncbi:MAG: putative phage major head protein [Firmicutes bacterium]|nr:putative phage major head protein [Bacillota bacterium]